MDGGTNQLHNYVTKWNLSKNDNYLPHIISGDFDSILPAVKCFYKDVGVKIIETPSQDDTDFTKALRIFSNTLKESNICVSIYCIIL